MLDEEEHCQVYKHSNEKTIELRPLLYDCDEGDIEVIEKILLYHSPKAVVQKVEALSSTIHLKRYDGSADGYTSQRPRSSS